MEPQLAKFISNVFEYLVLADKATFQGLWVAPIDIGTALLFIIVRPVHDIPRRTLQSLNQ